MDFVYDDGGRAAAGYKGTAGDCVCRSIAIVSGKPYAEVYRELNELAASERPQCGERSSSRTGVFKPLRNEYLKRLGFVWTPTMKIGSGCKVHLKTGELPAGRIIVSVSRHLTAVVDGVIHDTFDPSRGGKRCVYGYWRKVA